MSDTTKKWSETVAEMTVGQKIVAGLGFVALAILAAALLTPYEAYQPSVIYGVPGKTYECKGPALEWFGSTSDACREEMDDQFQILLPFAVLCGIVLGGIYTLLGNAKAKDNEDDRFY